MMSDPNTNCITMETIEQEIAVEYLDNLILIISIQKGKKENPRMHHPCANISKKNISSDVTVEIIESRLSFLTKKNRIENKLINRESSYFIKDQTLLNGPIQPNISDKSSPLSCKTYADVKIKEKKADI